MVSLTRRLVPWALGVTICLAGHSPAQAGVIPWLYNAVFGYGPVFGGYHGMGGYGCPVGGYGMGYPMPAYYPPTYIGPSTSPCGPGGCGTTTYYAGPISACCDPCAACNPCSTEVGTSPAPDSGLPAEPTPSRTPPGDDFERTTPRSRDELPMPNDGNAPLFEKPAPADPASPTDDDTVLPFGRNRDQVVPLTIEPAITATIAPVRRRTELNIGYRIPSVVRVAVTPSHPHAGPAVPQLAENR